MKGLHSNSKCQCYFSAMRGQHQHLHGQSIVYARPPTGVCGQVVIVLEAQFCVSEGVYLEARGMPVATAAQYVIAGREHRPLLTTKYYVSAAGIPMPRCVFAFSSPPFARCPRHLIVNAVYATGQSTEGQSRSPLSSWQTSPCGKPADNDANMLAFEAGSPP